MSKTELDAKIDALPPGGSVEISSYGQVRVTAERSGDGHTLRFVRHTENGSRVFRERAFAEVNRGD